MNKKIIIGGVLLVLLCGGLGAGYWFWFMPGEAKDEYLERAIADLRSNEKAPEGGGFIGRVRDMVIESDKIASGDVSAAERQEAALRNATESAGELVDRDFHDRRAINAMMTYVLSGGDASVAQKFATANAADADFINVLKGIGSYALRRPKTALKLLGGVDPRSPVVLQVAPFPLALAALNGDSNPTQTAQLFDEARLREPFTALEESAIRKEVPFLIKHREYPKAAYLIGRYIRVFNKSLFSTGFFEDLSTSIAALDEHQAREILAQVSEAPGEASEEDRSALFLAVARAALVSGKLSLAKSAAESAVALAHNASQNETRAKLYAAVAGAPTEGAAKELSILEKIEAGELGAEDIDIKSAAIQIAASVVRAAELSAAVQDKLAAENEKAGGAAEKDAGLSAFRPLIKRIDEKLVESGNTLEKAPK